MNGQAAVLLCASCQDDAQGQHCIFCHQPACAACLARVFDGGWSTPHAPDCTEEGRLALQLLGRVDGCRRQGFRVVSATADPNVAGTNRRRRRRFRPDFRPDYVAPLQRTIEEIEQERRAADLLQRAHQRQAELEAEAAMEAQPFDGGTYRIRGRTVMGPRS